ASVNGVWSQVATISGRWGHGAVYDPVRERMIVFGGYGRFWPPGNDLWELALTGPPVWTRLAPTGTRPSGRLQHSLIYDPVGDRLILFGGQDASNYLNDLWELSLAGPLHWTPIEAQGTLPHGRSQHVAVYDPDGARMIAFG